jgi:hypothetical protein
VNKILAVTSMAVALAAASPVLAQGNAQFCGNYALNVTGVVDLALKRNPACLDYTRGVHAVYNNHYEWCMRQPAATVQGAEANIRRLVAQCTGNAPTRPAQSASQPSAKTAPAAACTGLAGRYNGGASTITVSPGNAIRVTVGPNRPAGTGTCSGNRLSVNFPDDRLITGIFNGRTINWDNRTTWTRDASAPAPVPAPSASAPASSPVAMIEGLYRSGGKGLSDKATRERFLSNRLTRLIVRDERESARKREPGKLDYDLLTGAQDMVKFADLRVTETARRNDRATVRVTFRNAAFGNNPPPKTETVLFELQHGADGWRITDIKYSATHSLSGTLAR